MNFIILWTMSNNIVLRILVSLILLFLLATVWWIMWNILHHYVEKPFLYRYSCPLIAETCNFIFAVCLFVLCCQVTKWPLIEYTAFSLVYCTSVILLNLRSLLIQASLRCPETSVPMNEHDFSWYTAPWSLWTLLLGTYWWITLHSWDVHWWITLLLGRYWWITLLLGRYWWITLLLGRYWWITLLLGRYWWITLLLGRYWWITLLLGRYWWITLASGTLLMDPLLLGRYWWITLLLGRYWWITLLLGRLLRITLLLPLTVLSVRLMEACFLWQNDKEKRSGPFTSKFLSFLLTIVRLYVITIYVHSDFFPQESQFTFCNYLIRHI